MLNHPSYPDVVECFREMPVNPVAVECLQGGQMVIIVSRNVKKPIVSRCRGMFPRYPDVVECFRECRSILQSWNVSKAGTCGRHRKVTYDESCSPNSYQQHFPLAVMEFFGSPISTSGVAVIRICVVCVL